VERLGVEEDIVTGILKRLGPLSGIYDCSRTFKASS